MSIRNTGTLLPALLICLTARAYGQNPREVTSGVTLDTTIVPNSTHEYALRLSAGESANLAVTQIGVDLVVEVRAPDGTLSVFDSPNGRNGDELVEIIASLPGTYAIRVRPYDGREPAGKYRIRVTALRSATATREMLHGRELARDSAARWLARRSAAIPANAVIPPAAPFPPLELLASRARVMGIGEANHGSREFGDLRLSLTRRLIQRNGYRVVAIEGSSARLELLNHFIAGEMIPAISVAKAIERGWINRRPLRDLVGWLRQWNSAHSGDRVQLVGTDPQDNEIATDTLRAFLGRAYGTELLTRLAPTLKELAAADSQYLVFGDSDVDSLARRSILEIVGLLDLDAPMLTQNFGAAALERAREAAREMAELADLNTGDNRLLGHSRDWYMATRVLGALERRGPGTKAVFWAHNAHIGIRGDSPAGKSSGAWLREALGCEYAPIGVTFGQGSFVGQIPNDLTDRLAVDTLPASPAESIDGVLAALNPVGAFVAWPCPVDSVAVPGWLRVSHPMHWVGGLYAPGTAPSDAFRPYNLIRDFDGVIYVGKVTAEEMPTDRPLIPARKR
jgi:erythromycin esterase